MGERWAAHARVTAICVNPELDDVEATLARAAAESIEW